MPDKSPISVPVPVIIASEQEPVPVVMVPDSEALQTATAPVIVTKGEGATLMPTTTEAEDKTTEGQRRINLVWEFTQAFIAIAVTGVTVYVLASVSVAFPDVSANQLIAAMQLNVMATLILSFYFSRTNHAAIGGIGSKPNQPYVGR